MASKTIDYRVYVGGFEILDNGANPGAHITGPQAAALCRSALQGKPAGTVGRVDRVRYGYRSGVKREVADAQHRAYVVNASGIVERTDRTPGQVAAQRNMRAAKRAGRPLSKDGRTARIARGEAA